MEYPETIKKGGRVFKVRYRQSKSLRSSITFKNGEIVITLSRFLIGRKREEGVRKFLDWAEHKIDKVDGSSFVRPEYRDGGFVHTHNKIYEIKVEQGRGKRNFSRLFDEYLIHIKLKEDSSNEDVKPLVQKVIIKDQLSYLKSVVRELNDLYFQEELGAIRFKRMSSRFGSCSSKRNLNFAFNLLLTPREVFRYVCIHELAHLKEMNHSKKFWALVEIAEPNYKEYEKWLKQNSFLLI
ncbi:DUF45 domain-containing protein [Candidatus Peregrinibacteria bacterium]|nr:DUF45 domain-containing protein [Candidatus Peregrinibacteria bacterium]